MRLLCAVLLLLLTLAPVLAFDARVDVYPGGILVYPKDRVLNVSLFFEKNFIDNIEDLEYTLSVSGPAAFDSGEQDLSDSISTLDSSMGRDYVLYLRDTGTTVPQSLRITVRGSYVSNSYFAGGKKDLNFERELNVIGVDRKASNATLANEHLQLCQEALSACNSSASSLSVQLASATADVASYKQERDAARGELTMKQTQVFALWAALVVLVLVGLFVGFKWYGSARELAALRKLESERSAPKRKSKDADDDENEE